MQPLTAFHRSIERIYDKRRALRAEIDRVEAEKAPGFSSRIFHLWCEIDELDRQIGANYYWYAMYPRTTPALPPHLLEANQRVAPPMDA